MFTQHTKKSPQLNPLTPMANTVRTKCTRTPYTLTTISEKKTKPVIDEQEMAAVMQVLFIDFIFYLKS